MPPPVVSVVVMAYNHEPFVAQAIESVLAQRTSFPVEILVSEDCSSDRTRQIVQEYADRHGDRIRLLLSPANLNTNRMMSRGIEAATGRYVALLDADDYWTAEDKLQRQVDFLDATPACSVCFHDAVIVDPEGRVLEPRYLPSPIAPYTHLDDILAGNYVPSCGIMVRRDAVLPLPDWFDAAPFGDWPLLITAAMRGALGCLDQPLAAYRRHAGGVWSSRSDADQRRALIGFLDFLERRIGSEFREAVRAVRAQWCVNLFTLLEHGEHPDQLGSEVEAGLARGDLAHGSTDRRDVATNSRARITLGFGSPPEDQVGTNDVLGGFIDAVRPSPDGRLVIVQGWARMPDDDPCPTIQLDPGGQRLQAAIVRLPRPDVARTVDPALGQSGFWLYLSGLERLAGPIQMWVRCGDSRFLSVGVVRAA